MSLPDTIFIFMLALIIFGPKKLPAMAKQLGRLMGEFRRASNDFKFQIEEELRQADITDDQKKWSSEQTIALPAAETTEPALLPETSDAVSETSEPSDALPEPLAIVPAAGSEPRDPYNPPATNEFPPGEIAEPSTGPLEGDSSETNLPAEDAASSLNKETLPVPIEVETTRG